MRWPNTLADWPFSLVDLGDANNRQIITRAVAGEILWSVGIGSVPGVGWIYAATYKWLPRALHRIGATRKFGDEDVWDYTLNARVATVEYVHFRDFANQLVYAGRVASFSETDRLREVVPRDVQVFDFAGRMLYDTPMMYLARPPGQIHIGFPYQSPEARL